MPTAICQVGHPGSLDSLAVMLRAVGWDVMVPGDQLRTALKAAGLDTVISAADMARNWGGSLATAPHAEAMPADMRRADVVYVDTKAHRNAEHVLRCWPNLAGRVLWYRINGGEPVNVPGKGEEIDPPCPVLTPDLWYGLPDRPWSDRSHAFWPPFARWGRHQQPRADVADGRPLCLVHNLAGYGYGEVGEALRRSINLGCYGGYGSPDGVMDMDLVPGELARAICMVHLKSVDAPGYAVYEALASACPLVIPGRFIHRTRSHAVLEAGVTCLTFDDHTEGRLDVPRCVAEVEAVVQRLKDDPAMGRRVGAAGRERLRQHVWSPAARSSLDDLAEFLERHFA